MTALLDVHNLGKLYEVGKLPLWRRFTTHRNQEIKSSYLHAVSDLSFSMEAGESVGLVGESGCGKSTLVTLLSRLADPSSGTIHFNNRDLSLVPARQFGAREERADIQVVFQDPHDSLNPRHTGYQTIAEPLKRIRGLSSNQALRDRIMEIAAKVGLPSELLSRFPHQLSGGQKARINIARAIALEPKLLILDEPTSALDVSVQAVILRLLDDLRHDLGMSYIFVSHDLNVVRLLCDRLIVMYLGKIVEEGPAEEVFQTPRHPYTKALISAIPKGRGRDTTQIQLTGEPRSPIDPDPNVCRFYGRCPQGFDRCKAEYPKHKPAGSPGHLYSCHLEDTNSL